MFSGAETEGMIGYMIEQELGNLLPFEVPFATLLTMVEVDRDDPAFSQSDQVHRPGLRRGRGAEAQGREGLGDEAGRRQMAPRRRLAPAQADLRDPADQWLLEKGTIVIAAGGGGIPTVYEPGRQAARHRGGDRQGSLLRAAGARARRRPVHHGHGCHGGIRRLGQADAKAIRRASPQALAAYKFPAGSMGPKVDAACHFAEVTGKRAAIGALKDLAAMMEARAGTTITREAAGIEWAPS